MGFMFTSRFLTASPNGNNRFNDRVTADRKPEGYNPLLTTKNPKTQKPHPYLLTTNNPKMEKGKRRGYLTGIIHLAPADVSGYGNVCPCSTKECREHCLNTSGFGQLPTHQDARIERTRLYFEDRKKFINSLRHDIKKLIRQADKAGLIPAVRVNGTSDLPQVAMQMAKEFPDVTFYDYTKIPKPWTRTLPNYHLTFSLSETNDKDAMEALKHGVNVAVVFDIPKGQPMPEKWQGYPVIDGDLHDLRFLDHLEGVSPLVVGLRAKGKAIGEGKEDGFVQINPAKKPQ